MDNRLAALQKIVAEFLNEIELAFNSRPKRNSPDDMRLRYIFALIALSKFLKAITLPRNLSKRRIDELVSALDDINYGRVEAFLKPSGPASSANTTRIWCGRANVALAIHAYIEAGLTRELAAKKVADNFPGIRKLAAFERRKKQSSTKTKALNWYDEFRKPDSKMNPMARDRFEFGQQTTRNLSAERLHDFAKSVLAGFEREA